MTQITILADQLAFPEGPAFAPDGSLWFVELEGGSLTHWQPNGLERLQCGGQPNGLTFDTTGQAWMCDAERNAIRRFDLSNKVDITIADAVEGTRLFMPNDLAFDSHGNLLFTCPGGEANQPTGYVCCLRPDRTLCKIAQNMYFPNGLAFSADGTTLMIAETYRQRIWRGDWDATTCTWRNPQPWAHVGGTTDGPDGMAFGVDGNLYVAVYSLGCIKAIAPDGTTVAVYELPGNNPTNCAFDPSGQLGLVITEAERGLLLSIPTLGPGVGLFG